MMPHLVGEGSHESGGGTEENGVPLHRRQVVPLSGVGGRPLQEVFVDGIIEEEGETFCGMSCWLVIWMNGCFHLFQLNCCEMFANHAT
jgi:hypothetical protein